ncbi:MAG: hypothetical protein V4757_02335 [Pseudomonadota bacterium]
MIERQPSPATIKRMAAQAFHARTRAGIAGTIPPATVQAAAAQAEPVHMTHLPYLARRLLRIIARHEHITAEQLYLEADFPGRIEADHLTLLGLIERHTRGTEFSFEITQAGAQCVANEPPRKSAQTLKTGEHNHA